MFSIRRFDFFLDISIDPTMAVQKGQPWEIWPRTSSQASLPWLISMSNTTARHKLFGTLQPHYQYQKHGFFSPKLLTRTVVLIALTIVLSGIRQMRTWIDKGLPSKTRSDPTDNLPVTTNTLKSEILSIDLDQITGASPFYNYCYSQTAIFEPGPNKGTDTFESWSLACCQEAVYTWRARGS